MGNMISQCYFIPTPTLTEKNLPDQKGKVHLVTGGYAGCGAELVKMLYQHNATVYVAGRSQEKAEKTINAIKQEFPDSAGKIEFLQLDLADVSTIKKSAEEFMSKEDRLDVLTNNAGVMMPPVGSTDAHNHEQQTGTNVLGPFTLTQCLLPLLKKTAASSPQGQVRVTWAASLASYMAPKNGVTILEDGTPKIHGNPQTDYAQSKAANVLLAAEFAERHGKDNLISVSWNPGNLKTELARHMPSWQVKFMNATLLYPARMGGYTELYAACSDGITLSQNGAFVAPWGRVVSARSDLLAAGKDKEFGGTGTAKQLYEWCEKEMKQYL